MEERRIPCDDRTDERPADLGSRPCVPTDGVKERVWRERGLPPVTDESRMLTAAMISLLRARLAESECGVRSAETAA